MGGPADRRTADYALLFFVSGAWFLMLRGDMRFGINFFPSVDPALLTGRDYYRQALALAARADELGYRHICTAEHYFRGYGGYSPNPVVFLTAVA